MDTQTAAQVIKDLKTTIDSQLIGYKAQSDALGVSTGIIQATLVTQSTILEAQYRKTIDDANATIVAKDDLISQKDAKIADLQAQLDAIIKPNNPINPVTP